MNNRLSNKSSLLKPKVQQKRRVLCWADFSLSSTGFGKVAKHILDSIHNTGLYEIDHLAINFYGEFYSKEEVPYTVIPSRLDNPQDPYGSQMFINALQKKDYDLVFICNDTFVVEEVAKHINEIKDVKKQKKQTVFKLVYYYPVDCRLLPEASTMVKVADRSVAYTNFAKQSSLDIGVQCTDVIYHGADVKNFFPISKEERKACRKQYLGIDSDDIFVWVTGNRNNPRKDIAKTLMAFVEFKNKICSNSKLYAHTKIVDNFGNGNGSDLRPLINELKIDITKDIIFPNKYSAAKGFPVNVLNQLINCGDAFITNNLGEGYGLFLVDSMSAGVPVVSPNHTSAPEILGFNGLEEEVRGYPIDCKERCYIDLSGSRPLSRMEDILSVMEIVYKDWLASKDQGDPEYIKERKNYRKGIINRGIAWTKQYSWDNICKDWIKLFDETYHTKIKNDLNGEII